MTEIVTLEELEAEFEIVLPADYKKLIVNYPDRLREHDGSGGAFRRYSQGYLLQRVDDLQYYNRLIRRKVDSWPQDWFVIGLDRVESYYVIDLSSESTRVSAVGDDNYGFEDEDPTLDELTEILCDMDPRDVTGFIAWIFQTLEHKELFE